MNYAKFNTQWRCTQIKDRNGNYLTVNYSWQGNITNITDTLGRVVTFNYDANANLLSISQLWNGIAHAWVTFGWGTHNMQSAFSGVQVVGAPNGTNTPVVTQVGLHDGSRYNFEYTNGLQAQVIRRYSSDNVQRSYTAVTYDGSSSDVPRLSESRVSADNWTSINDLPAEVMTQYSDPGDGSHQMIVPDGTVYKEFYGTGWQKGLTTLSEVWSGGVKQKWSTIAWTQDNTSVNYHVNPRATETNVYDAAGNRRRVGIDYHSSFGLPLCITEYGADAISVIRYTVHHFVWSSTYLNRRIIGLPESDWTFDSGWAPQSKTTYGYDWGSHLEALPNGATAGQHDSANFGLSLVAGRGNLSQVVRWNVNFPDNFSEATEMKYGHNITGSVTFTRDHLWHQNFFSYTDSFSDNINRNTFAYLTTATNGDGKNSYLKYNFDHGAVTRTEGPQLNQQTPGIVQTSTYDGAGRLDRVTTTNNGAYTRFVYGTHYVGSYATVNTVADQAYAVQTFDGLGRIVGTASNHPGSSGGYKAQLTQYDQMGRAMKKSNPAEMNGSWVPAGDDVAGWLYTQQTYDWNGRPLVTTNTDLTTRTASYGGCGCAGGEVVTLTDEGTLVGGVTKKRQQKIYSDVLGRTRKTEILNWNGAGPYGTGGTVYSATVNTYNARDQVTLVRQYAGAEGSGTYQDTTMSYDGFGRLKTRHVPEQNAGTATEWFYNADDTIQKITDARGASQIFSYNGRHLVEGVTYSAPTGSGITVPAAVDFNYDGAGNRTSMTDGLGWTTYVYNGLSAMTSETRHINDLGSNYQTSYSYNLAGELKTVTDPFGGVVTYTYDSAAQLKVVNGPSSNPQATYDYLRDIKYRAWGEYKKISYGENLDMDAEYNNRLKISKFKVAGFVEPYYGQGASYVVMMQSLFDYNADGRVKGVRLAEGGSYANTYTYDQSSRIQNGSHYLNYFQTYGYDVWSNLTSRTGSYYGATQPAYSASYVNNRNTVWGYDQEGNTISDGQRQYSYDAANHPTFVSVTNTRHIRDGDGRTTKVDKNGVVTHYLRSSVMSGKIIVELTSQGMKKVRYVYANGQLLAELVPQFGVDEIFWVHENPVTSERMVNAWCGIAVRLVSHDSLGNAVENYGYANTCFASEPDPTQELMQTNWDAMYGNPYDAPTGCYIDGIERSCDAASHLVNIGVGVELPPGFSANRYQTISNGVDFRLAVLYPHGDGFSGGVITYWASVVKPRWDSPRDQLLIVGTRTLLPGLPQNPSQGLNPIEGQKRWDHCMNKYLPQAYPGGRNKPTGQAVGAAMRAAYNDTNDSALILGIIAKESGFSPTPTQDHGPMQLTSWVKNYLTKHAPDLIVPGSYDPFGRKSAASRNRPFTGDYDANVQTGENWIRYQRNNLGMSDYQITYGWGPGPTWAIRDAYAKDALNLRDLYAPFVNCLKTGQ